MADLTDTTQTDREAQARELAALIAKATDEDLSDDGRYFADTYSDLTRCRHEEIGEYQHTPDGKLVEWLWNRRHDILAAFATPPIDDAPEPAVPDRFANDLNAKALYDCWDDQPGWVPWVERGNSDMQERARREAWPLDGGNTFHVDDDGMGNDWFGDHDRAREDAAPATSIAGGAGIDDDPPGDIPDFALTHPDTYALANAVSAPPPVQAGEVERLHTLAKANNDLARMNSDHRDEWRAKAYAMMEALKPFAAMADEWDRWQAKGSTSTPGMIRLGYGRCQIGIEQYQTARSALSTPVSQPIEDRIRAEERERCAAQITAIADGYRAAAEKQGKKPGLLVPGIEWAAAALRQSGAERGETA